MSTATIFTDRKLPVGQSEATLFGSFVEHLGRCVYTGIYEPGHTNADSNGFRQDVIELVQGLQVPVVRYPGGNFLSGYDWRDGVGKKETRPQRLDLAWQTTETNQFGTDEFMAWCRTVGAEPMMGVNLGTGTPLEAAQLLEYCNHTGGTYWSDLRRENGSEEPYRVKTWCLGNEMDGPWQICGMTAEDYGKKALAAAKMMRLVDPSIKLVVCGSSTATLPTFPEWDRIVLDMLYDEVDYISMHSYYHQNGSLEDFFASGHAMDNFIKTIKATADYVQAKRRSPKQMNISFDEWNIWYPSGDDTAGWTSAPRLLENKYSFKDALVFGGLLNTLINNCDRVKMACLAQLVNVIAPIFTEPGGKAIKQTTYFPFEYASRYGRGTVLKSISDCPAFESRCGMTDYMSSSIVHRADAREITVFLTNYAPDDMTCELEIRGFGALHAIENIVLANESLDACNTLENPETVKPEKGDTPAIKDDRVTATMKAHSYSMLRLGY